MAAKKKAVAVIVLVAIIAAAVYGYQNFFGKTDDGTLSLSGNVDVREVSVAFNQSDRIAELLVQEGDTVKQGQVLARLDNRELVLKMRRLQAEIAAQQGTVDKLHNGTRIEEVRQAEENVKQAQAAAEYSRGLYNRKQAIFDSVEGISQQELDTAMHDYEAKSAALAAAQEAYKEAIAGPRAEDIAIGEASLLALQEEYARYEYLLSQYELQSPSDGVVRSRLLESGDMASPSKAVFKVSLLDKKWVRAYVSETELGRVYEGQQATVYIDSFPDKPVSGQIGYISSTAEFTPKTVQTDDLRTALVYEIRVYVDDKDNVLRMGMPATVKIAP